MSEDEPEGRLAGWSRRKRAAARGEPEADAQADAEPVALEIDEQASAALEAELEANRAAAEAVDFDSLHAGSDYTIFLKAGVPAELKRRALRILWRSDPKFAVLDGLNNYDLDYRDPKRKLDAFQSAWQVGKGYVKKELERARRDDVARLPPEPAEEVPEPEALPEPLPEEAMDEEAGPDGAGEPEPAPAGRTSLRNRLL